MKKKILSLVLVFLMALSVLPAMGVNAEGAALTAITTTVGSLSPEFSADTLYYKIELANLDTMPVISAAAAEGYTAAVVQPSAANGYVSSITVTNGSDSKTYYVRLVPTEGERIVPVAPVEALSSPTKSGYSISEAIDSNPDTISGGNVADSPWQSEYVANNAYFTVDLGRVMDVTKARFRALESTNSMVNIAKLYVSNDGETFTEATSGIRSQDQNVRDDIYNMGGRHTQWVFSTPVETRYLRVESSTGTNVNLCIGYTTVYARTYADSPALESLAVNGNTHTLSPSFDPDIYDYTVEVDDLTSLPQLSATAPAGYTAAVTQMAEADSYSDNYVARIKVTNNEIAFDEKVYTVRALSTQHDAMLPLTYQESGCTALHNSYFSFEGGIDLSDVATSYNSKSGENGCYTVDLGGMAKINEIRYNQRINQNQTSYSSVGDTNEASVASFEKIEVSTDGISFTDITDKAVKTSKLGSDNLYNLSFYQISFKLNEKVQARYVRVSNDDAKSLWINGTEVFGSLIPSAKLSSLTTDIGTLSPAFDKDTQYYKIELNNLDTIPTISAAAPAGCTYQIEQPAKANNYTATVTADNGNEGTKVYKVRLVPASDERVIPVTPIVSLSTETASGYDIAEAVDANPDYLEDDTTVADSIWYSVAPDTGYAHLTVDAGRVTDITKIIFYGENSNSWMNSITKLYVSSDGVNFKEATTVGTRSASTAIRSDIYGMGGRYVRWTFDSPVEARYIRAEQAKSETALKMGYVIAYARTFAEAPSLESLTVNGNTHTLSPSFDPDVYEYTVEVDDLTSLPELSATAPAGYTAAVTQMAAAGTYADNYVARIKVTNNEVAFDEKVYTVRALSTRHNAMLPLTYQKRGCDAVTNAGYYSFEGGIDLSDPSTLYFSSNGKSSANSYANQYSPYYTVDLGCVANISEVRFNQRANNHPSSASLKGDTNTASAAYFEKLEISSDGINFYDVMANTTKTSGLGSDNIYNLPYYQISFKFNEAVDARYIRVSSDENVSLWIRGTEVFGKLKGDGVSHSLDVSSGKATAVYKVQEGYENSRIILALYKIVEDGIDNTPDATLSFVGAKVSGAAANGTVTAEYDIPDGNTDEYVVKAYVLESMGTIVPIALSRGI